ncbi:MAG: hypothetical protein VYD78_01810 [Gemmatimonadota bacterium]|nr:hypothetical protein [Gemmatimonadota bacterium]
MVNVFLNRGLRIGLALSLLFGPIACQSRDLSVPSGEEARARFRASSTVSVGVTGNVIEVNVNQPFQQIRRGGVLWAKVGPYVYLFTEEAETLLRDYPGVSGIRVITRTSRRNTEVARAFLRRDALNEITWKRARNIAGRARRDGTRRPVLLEELIEWGQDHTEFTYSDQFVG